MFHRINSLRVVSATARPSLRWASLAIIALAGSGVQHAMAPAMKANFTTDNLQGLINP
jgi:hypothetical protein